MAKNRNENDTQEVRAEQAKQTKLIRMVCDAENGPTIAEVHPDEVENYLTGNWRLDK